MQHSELQVTISPDENVSSGDEKPEDALEQSAAHRDVEAHWRTPAR